MMTPLFRVVLVVVSIGTLATVLKRIQKAKLTIEDSIFWILLAMMFVVFALFPIVPDTLARLLGIYSTANFLFLFMIFILLMRMFSMSMRISTLEDKIRMLVQELALRDKDARDAASTDQAAAAPDEGVSGEAIRAEDALCSSSRHLEKNTKERSK